MNIIISQLLLIPVLILLAYSIDVEINKITDTIKPTFKDFSKDKKSSKFNI